MMFDLIRRHWLRLLRVPPEPTPIPGETGRRVFRAARRYYHWRLITWGVSQFFAFTGLFLFNLLFAFMKRAGPDVRDLPEIASVVLTTFVWVAFLVQLVITYVHVRLDYDQRWYILTDRSLRIREGVFRLTEKTMTFANIQHLTVRQGPLQRLLGISDLVVRSAGGGGGTPGEQSGQVGSHSATHTAYFRGVDNAEEIRAAIRDRIRLHRDAGLGDPDDQPPAAAPVEAISELLSAVRTLGEEASALRETLARTTLR